MSTTSITVTELAQKLNGNSKPLLIDVRNPKEYAEVHAAGALSLPLGQLSRATLLQQYPAAAQDQVYLICLSGHRSQMAYAKLQKEGMTNLINVEGGTLAWQKAQLPVVQGSAGGFSIDRQVKVIAGLLALLGIALAWWVHPLWIWLSAFVGVALLFAGMTGVCGVALLLSVMPWNRP